MSKPRPLIAGNWKMNGRQADGLALAEAIRAGAGDMAAELLLCPPATLIALVGEKIRGTGIALGGQDCHWAASGPHTGDIAAPMLADLGCRYVILGHSERRHGHGETDAMVKSKAAAALAAGLIAIICLGETEAERDRGEAEAVVGRQLEGSLPEGASPDKVVVAYEPVWAIGTGKTPSDADIVAVHGLLRRDLAASYPEADSFRLLYGGSVKPGNCEEILGLANVDGALVGGASLKEQEFLTIARTCG
jgi:triosephosphate isomerase